MRSKRTRLGLIVILAVVGSLSPAAPQVARADHGQPPLDPSLIDYTPIGYYGPADEGGVSATIPTTPPQGPPPAEPGPNPSGKWVAYDMNVWESLHLPSRHPGDNCNELTPEEQAENHCEAGDLDPDDDGPQGYSGPSGAPAPTHGRCPESVNPIFAPWGECFNSQLEWLDHYEASMTEMLADLGGTIHRYPFISPGDGERGTALAAAGGQAWNIAAVVPGADHPEQTVLVSGHYDFTDSGPAAAWDSAEGHTEVMRMAYIMADYWRKTGTRPSATVKFIPWDSEESGTHGSADYVANNIPPGEEHTVRGYFNVDPCAGAYPAFKDGNFAQQVPEVMQLANPENQTDPDVVARMEAFNAKAEIVVDQVFDYLDDTVTTPAGEVPIFVSDAEAAAGENGGESQRDMIVTAVGGLLIFTSDYRNFEGAGIPIFNLFPDYFGPHADGTPASSEGITILHTPNDNLTRINKLTSGLATGNVPDPTGLFASEGWAKGMEMCAQIESWYMLQPEMAGTQTANTEVVAYFEALPNEAIVNQAVNFDAAGTYQYADAATRELVPGGDLTYSWDFGDGTSGVGKNVEHAYAEIGRYQAALTVTGQGGSVDTMTIPITVIGSTFTPPVLHPIDPDDAADGDFPLTWDFEADRDGFDHFSVQESTDLEKVLTEDAEGAITDQWVVEPPDEGVEPWQRSDSDTNKWMGNKRHSGDASFWTGVTPENSNPPPLNAGSSLVLANPVAVPNTTTAELGYWSLFKNQSVDRGRLEVAIDDGDPATAPDFQTLEILGGPEEVFSPSEPDSLDAELEFRRVDLGAFAGKNILLRFTFQTGASNPVLSQPAGWYIDDLQIQAGTFEEIGTPTEQTFQVSGKAPGTYHYRVVGVYNDGVQTAGSNTESAEVTGGEAPKCPGHEDEPGNHIVGTGGSDELKGTGGRDVICGLGGKDELIGKAGKDLLLGGAGADEARGGKRVDRIIGGKGPDELRGGKGADFIKGNRGRDALFGQKGPDTLRGGPGSDTCKGGPGNDDIKGCEA